MLCTHAGAQIWAEPPSVRLTYDYKYYGGARVTTERGKPPVYLDKRTLDRVDVSTPDGHAMRIAVAVEAAVRPPSAGDAVESVRIKRRATFNYKREMAYELTEVRTGGNEVQAASAPPEYEVRRERQMDARRWGTAAVMARLCKPARGCCASAAPAHPPS